jgi:lycopene elongase/hydratase (dihydrobisanhydrobacterioruberin-forming)
MLGAAVPDGDTGQSRDALPGAGRQAHVSVCSQSLIPLRAVLRLAVVSRPAAWVPATLVYTGGVTIDSRAGMTWSTWTGLVFVTMPMGLIVFGANDIADIKSDALNIRKGGAWGAIVQATESRLISRAAAACAIVFFLLSLASQHYLAALSILGISVFAWAYSVKPVRLKARPISDSLSNGFWVVCMFCSGYYSSTIALPSNFPAVHILIVLLLCGAAVHALTTLLDYEVDKVAGDTTIGILLGQQRTLALAAALFAICFFMVSNPVLMIYFGVVVAMALIAFLHAARRNVQWLIIAVLALLLPALAVFDISTNIR